MRKFSMILVIILAISSCKSTRNASDSSTLKTLSAKKIINNYYKNTFDQNSIDAKIKANYQNNKTSVSVIIKLRMEKDKTIWLSATKLGFPIAKVKITPTRVSYYEKLRKTYFDGDFSLLSEWLGTDLNFDEVQNLLLGQAFSDLKKEKYNSQISNNLYQLRPKIENELFNILFLVNPNNYKLNRQEISHPKEQQRLSVSYKDYQEIKGEQFPKEIHISAIDNKKITKINLEYRSIEFNNKLSFPFSIPKGYKEIKLK